MADPTLIAVAAGLSLGIVAGYRLSRVVVAKVGGPFADRWLVKGTAAFGAFLVMVPAAIMAVLIALKLGGPMAGPASPPPPPPTTGSLIGLALGMGLFLASSLIVGAFAGGLCARLIEETRGNRDDPGKGKGRD